MTDFNSDEYKVYYKDQEEDNNVIMPDVIYKYMDLLTKDKLPEIDYKTIDVLDVGARAFETWDYFLEKYDREIVGIDVGREGLDHCKEHGKHGMSEVDAHRMDEHFAAEQFDLIIALHSLEHMYDLPLVLNNCNKLLKPGGYLFFALPIPSFNWKRGHWYDVPNNSVMLKMCADAKFTNVLYEELISDYKYRPEQEMVGLVQKVDDE
jgi:2-polyprenyl-3-methyl-5-hydroxy-6-metoxy-1,4-benzoquinol methylase